MADLEFYQLSMTGAEADSGIRTGMEVGATSGILLGDGNGGVTAATPGKDFGYPLLKGNGPPTGNTAANIGQHYFDMQATQAPYEYICVGLNSNGFIWLVFGDTGDGFKISGYFASLEALEAAISAGTVASPAAGTAYGIGETAPYDVYVWDAINSTWINNGPLGSSGGGSGVPPHGNTGQVLKKLSDADYDVGWGEMVNPNLLDNWYFGNPVNQRGQESYDLSATAAYGLDRWWSAFGVFSIGNFIEINATHTQYGAQLRQAIANEDAQALAGKTITVSVLMKSGSGTLTLAKTTGMNSGLSNIRALTLNPGINTFTTVVPTDVGDAYPYLLFGISVPINGSAEIVAAKLELGDTQTLAHQDENGNWVLNEIPNYGEQLARCQRIAVEFDENATAVGVGVAQTASSVLCHIPLPVTMRATPVITMQEIGLFGTGGLSAAGSLPVTGSSDPILTANGLRVMLTTNGATTGATYLILVKINGKMLISSDL